MSETFGQYLHRHRKASGLTQRELGEKADISQSYVSGIEREVNKDISRDDVLKIARVLNISPSEALTVAGLSVGDLLVREGSPPYGVVEVHPGYILEIYVPDSGRAMPLKVTEKLLKRLAFEGKLQEEEEAAKTH